MSKAYSLNSSQIEELADNIDADLQLDEYKIMKISKGKDWPEFETKDSTYFAHKNKFVPKLPTSLLDLKDLPADYKLTTTKKPFLASPIDKLWQYLFVV